MESIQVPDCIRCRAQRSVRIDARNGHRLGGYDYNDAPGYLLKGGGPADGRRAVGIAALRYWTT
jgi:hypothetical protein